MGGRKEHAFNFLLCLGPDVTYITLLRTMKSLSFHYLQINRLDCHSFMNADRRHKIPESETVDSLSLTSKQVKGFELSSAVSIELSRRSMIKLYLSHTGDDLETQQLQKLWSCVAWRILVLDHGFYLWTLQGKLRVQTLESEKNWKSLSHILLFVTHWTSE